MQAVMWTPRLLGAVRTFKTMDAQEMAQRKEDQDFLDALNLNETERKALNKWLEQPRQLIRKMAEDPWY